MVDRIWGRRVFASVVLLTAATVFAVPSRVAGQTLVELAAAQARYTSVKRNAVALGVEATRIAAIDEAIMQAMRSGNVAEGIRQLAKGTVLLSGQAWTDPLDYASSVALRSDRLFVDSSTPSTFRLEQIYSPALAVRTPLTVHVTVHDPPKTGATGPATRGALVKDVGTFLDVPADLRTSPFQFDIDFAGFKNGRYVVELEVSRDAQLVALRGLIVDARKGLDARLADFERRLARVKPALAQAFGDEVRYAADFMRNVDKGIVEAGLFDADREMAAAEHVLRALERGNDPFAGRTGDFKRHYFFAEAGEIMPYHVYVPRRLSRGRPLPLLVMLHGSGGDEDLLFAMKSLPELAEERGYLVVSPLGYRADGRYGAGTTDDEAVRRRRALSEADVLNVIELMRKQYPVDEDRIYVLGHSMGAGGAWHLAEKFPDRWAAIACFSGSAAPEIEARIKQVPQLVVHGDEDPLVSVDRSRAMVAEMKRLGVVHRYIEVPGGDHVSVVESNLEAAFDFFDDHPRHKRSS